MRDDTSTRDGRVRTRSNAGCPPQLLIDLTHTDDLGPQVEWPPAPPTRHNGDRAASASGEDVAHLTTGRAVHLLDAAVDHLRTALEAARDAEEGDRLERAITDVARARETLGPLAG